MIILKYFNFIINIMYIKCIKLFIFYVDKDEKVYYSIGKDVGFYILYCWWGCKFIEFLEEIIW